MSPRRWFWAFILAFALALLINEKFLTPAPPPPSATGAGRGLHDEPGFPAQIHAWFRDNVAGTLLLPVAAPLRWVQERFERLGSGLRGETPGESANGDEIIRLREENLRLHNLTYWLMGQVEARDNALKDLRQFSIFTNPAKLKLVRTNVVAFGTGQAGQTVTLDRGTIDGIRPGAVVLAQNSPIGRVISAGSRVSTVRLLTDPDRHMWVMARLGRHSGPNITPIAEECQVRGTGDGLLRCDSIDATRGLPPEKGDIVQLEDNSWDVVRGAKLGEVTEVTRLENQQLRWNLLIKPAVNIGENAVVWVITGQ